MCLSYLQGYRTVLERSWALITLGVSIDTELGPPYTYKLLTSITDYHLRAVYARKSYSQQVI